jgi:sulfur carrier protein ThiS
MEEYYIEAVEPAYVTTHIKFNEDGTKEFDTREQESTGMENMPRFYRVKREDDSEVLELENEYGIAEDLVILLNNGEIVEEEILELDKVAIKSKVEGMEVER